MDRPPPLLGLAAAALLAGVALPGRSSPLRGDLLVPLPLETGQTLLIESRQRADYGPLAEQFLTQANLAYCGVASIVMVLNSLAVPAPAAEGYGSHRFWTQQNVFEAAASRTVVAPDVVAREGMTLQQLAGLLTSHGLTATPIHGDTIELDAFRTLLRANLRSPADRLLVNYHRQTLGQTGGGHISPLAAYHEASDRVLILDVARYRYPSVWVPVEALWRAIRTLDTSSGRSRGLVSIRAPRQR